jgi:hypothetical protein
MHQQGAEQERPPPAAMACAPTAHLPARPPQAAQQQLWEQLGALHAQAEAAQAAAGAACSQLEQKADREQVAGQLAQKAGRADLEAVLATKVDVATYLATSAAQAKALGAAGIMAGSRAAGGRQGPPPLGGQQTTSGSRAAGLGSAAAHPGGGRGEGRADDALIRAVYSQLQSLPAPRAEEGGGAPAAAAAGADRAWMQEAGASAGAELQLGRSGSGQVIGAGLLGAKLPQFSRFHPTLLAAAAPAVALWPVMPQ